jgi:hypothetical protein
MAKYIGSLTTDARGKLGGLVMTRARNGTNLKAKGIPTQPRSNYQSSLRALFASALIGWRALTTTQVTTWQLLAPQYTYVNSLGQSYSPTALQLWTQAWVNAGTTSLHPPGLAPTSPPYVDQLVGLSATVVAGVLKFSAFDMSGAYTGGATLSSSSVLSPSINYTTTIRRRPMGRFEVSGVIFGTAAWEAAYGPLPAPGQNLSCRAQCYDPISFIGGTPYLQIVTVV